MSEPIITFNNRTLRVEDPSEGWLIETQVLASGRQIMVRCTGQFDGEMVIMPAGHNRIFISSRASEKETTQNVEPERSDSAISQPARRAAGTKR